MMLENFMATEIGLRFSVRSRMCGVCGPPDTGNIVNFLGHSGLSMTHFSPLSTISPHCPSQKIKQALGRDVH